MLHVIRQADFLQAMATGGDRDPWIIEHADAKERMPFEDVRAALARTRERLVAFCATATDEDLERPTEQVEGVPTHLVGVPLQQILARTTGHVFAHAGELSALASLMGAPDLGLPGAMPASRGLEPDAG